ncbi:EVE domain-containing protein [Hyphomonas sp.]|uniref:EVE domain-containing protein n=1 Tax=Hyphomonas sp. TaxID=87 RepID=UPI0030FB5CCC
MKHWLFKSEPDAFSIDDLADRPGATEPWDGIRNYQARNLMRDDMRLGDSAFFYHSSCAVPGIVGIVSVTREAYPDHTARDPDSRYHDPKATEEEPRWMMVDVTLVRRFAGVIPLTVLKATSALEGMPLLKRGNRLSIQPVSAVHWRAVLRLADALKGDASV